MQFSLSRDEKIEAARIGLAACEEEVFVAAMALGISVVDIPDNFSSSDPSQALLDAAMKKLRNANKYISTL